MADQFAQGQSLSASGKETAEDRCKIYEAVVIFAAAYLFEDFGVDAAVRLGWVEKLLQELIVLLAFYHSGQLKSNYMLIYVYHCSIMKTIGQAY